MDILLTINLIFFIAKIKKIKNSTYDVCESLMHEGIIMLYNDTVVAEKREWHEPKNSLYCLSIFFFLIQPSECLYRNDWHFLLFLSLIIFLSSSFICVIARHFTNKRKPNEIILAINHSLNKFFLPFSPLSLNRFDVTGEKSMKDFSFSFFVYWWKYKWW